MIKLIMKNNAIGNDPIGTDNKIVTVIRLLLMKIIIIFRKMKVKRQKISVRIKVFFYCHSLCYHRYYCHWNMVTGNITFEIIREPLLRIHSIVLTYLIKKIVRRKLHQRITRCNVSCVSKLISLIGQMYMETGYQFLLRHDWAVAVTRWKLGPVNSDTPYFQLVGRGEYLKASNSVFPLDNN